MQNAVYVKITHQILENMSVSAGTKLKNLYAIVKRRVGFENANFHTKTGEEIAARRGGVQVRQDFFNSILAELEEYE